MKLCMMSCMLSGLSPREIIQTAKDCGMDAIDWVTTHHTDPGLLKKMCDDAGVKIVSHTMLKQKFLQRVPSYLDEFKASLEDACRMGAPILMLPPFPRQDQVSMEDDRKAWIEYYAQAYPLAHQAGVTLTLESTGVVNSPIVTASEVMEVLKTVPGLKVTLDNGNMETAGDARYSYMELKDYVVHFHLKDWRISDVPGSYTTYKRCGKHFADTVIGRGDVDLKAFWNTVDAKGRQLYVNLETYDPYGQWSDAEVQKMAADLVRNW